MLFYFACEAAGASAPGIPHALLGRKRLAQLGRIRAARTQTLARRLPTRVAATATHHSSSPRTRGPITTGSSLCRCRPAASLNTSGTAYGSLRSQGRHRCWDDTGVIAAIATHHPLTPQTHRLGNSPDERPRLAKQAVQHHILHKFQGPTASAWPPPPDMVSRQRRFRSPHVTGRMPVTACGGGDI